MDPRYIVGTDDPARQNTMTSFAPVSGLVGGALIGLAAIILMLTIGRIAGVCGIALNAVTASDAAGRSWRLAFLLGLPLGALLVSALGLKDWSSITFPATTPAWRLRPGGTPAPRR